MVETSVDLVDLVDLVVEQDEMLGHQVVVVEQLVKGIMEDLT
jgi:hypothetical protein